MCPAIGDCMVIGEGRRYPIALITLKCVFTDDTTATDELDDTGKVLAPPVSKVGEAIADPRFVNVIAEAIKKANNNPKVIVHRSHKIAKFTILPHSWSVDHQELTPTRKLKRSVILERYDDAIEAMYVVDPNLDSFYQEYDTLE